MAEKISAYAVFDGGGIKGIAFAGALKAIENSNIQIIGYAGTSSGALIAYLSSIGYSGDEIYTILEKLDFTYLLGEPVKNEIDILKNVVNKRIGIGWVKEKAGFFRKAMKLRQIDKCVSKKDSRTFDAALKRLIKNYGLYSKEKVKELLKCLTENKIPHHLLNPKKDHSLITFEDHYAITKKDLRIIATNLNNGNALEFSHINTPKEYVLDALLASASYPIVFEPSRINDDYVADGGLSCNLPTYTFYNDSFKKFPIFAFDLVPIPEKVITPKKKTAINNFFEYINSMINASLDASTNIISTVTGGVAITIRLPQETKATDFKLDLTKKKNLFKRGERYTRYIINHSLLTSLIKDIKNKHDLAKLLYGRHEILLNSLACHLPSQEYTIKAWLYTTIDKLEKEIISFSKGTNKNDEIIKDYIFSLEEEKLKSCAESWVSKNTFPSYDSEKKKSFISYPIKVKNRNSYKHKINSEDDQYEILALLVLSIDCDFQTCNWFTIETNKDTLTLDISDKTYTILRTYEHSLRYAIMGHQTLFHENRGGIQNA